MSILAISRQKNRSIERLGEDHDTHAPVIVAIGGVLTMKQVMPLYKRILDLDTNSDLSAAQRFVPPYGRGTGSVELTRSGTRDRLLRVHEASGDRKMLLVGHSLGGLIATIFAYENPESVAGVVCLAGAQEGIKRNTIAMRGLAGVIHNPEATAMVRHDSGFMQEHLERVRTEWPTGVPLHAVSTAHDVLIPAPHGFGLQPNDQPTTNTLVMSKMYGYTLPGYLLKKNLPDNTRIITTGYPTEHVAIPCIPTVVDYVAQVRDDINPQTRLTTGILPAAG